MPTLGTYEVELKDGYVVAARDSAGAAWTSDIELESSPEVVDFVQELRAELEPAQSPAAPARRARASAALVGIRNALPFVSRPVPDDAGGRIPLRQSSYHRALTHAAVLGAALVPMSFTVAHAETSPVRDQRITIPLALDAATTHDTFVISPLRAAAAADALAPVNPAAAIADGTPQAPPPPPRPSAAAAPVAGSGGRFPWGYCTYYVSTKRFVPWSGNAIDWWPNARAMGFPEGMTARAGAIMVTRESYVGHVAYVESVDPSGGFTISEMNFKGFGIVDERHFGGNPSFLVGFIY